MLVVLEGCDGAGKTTLARSLAKILDADIIHCTSRTPNDKKFFEGIIEASKTKNIIADRFCYGQYVYQEKKDRPLGGYAELNYLEAKMLAAGAKVIYVAAPPYEIEERLAERGEKLINGLNVSEVIRKFDEIFELHSILGDSVMLWNTGGGWK